MGLCGLWLRCGAMIQVEFKRSKKLRIDTKIKQALDRISGSDLTVGVHKDAGSYPATTKGGKEGATIALVANCLEYGTDTMPARSFMRPAVDENRGAIQRMMDRAIVNVGWNGWTVERALSRIGSQLLRFVQNKVKSNVPPPLSEAYLARKLKLGMPERTLIATGLLLRSLAYRVNLSSGAQAESEAARSASAPSSSPARTGDPDSRAAGRAQAKAMKAAARAARKSFAGDKDKQERFKRQQATKGHK